MRYLRQFMVILSVTCAAEVIKYFLPYPIPASIYGLVLMFLLLGTGLIRLPQVKETAEFLIEIMPVMFIPAAVGLLESWEVLRPILRPVAVIVPVTTVRVPGRVKQVMVSASSSTAASIVIFGIAASICIAIPIMAGIA